MRLHWNWGWGLATAYTTFALSTIGFVGFAMSRPVALVREDYYAESLREDQKREAMLNARALGAGLSIAGGGGQDLVVRLPIAQVKDARGTITLYRPSDPGADREVALAPGRDGIQVVPLREIRAGRWLIQLRWRSGGRPFYAEREIDR